MAKCRICSAPHKSCGPSTTVTLIDQAITDTGGDVALKEYEVTVDGRHPQKTTMLLSDADAKRLGVLDQPTAKSGPRPANKSRKPANKTTKRKPAVDPNIEDASDPDASE